MRRCVAVLTLLTVVALQQPQTVVGAGFTSNGKFYDTTPKRQDGKINVHIVPHTHDDVGRSF